MNLFTNKTTGPLAYIIGGLTAFVVGCVITTGNGDTSSNECGSIGSNSQQVGNECRCDPGFELCNPNDDNDFDCCEIPGKVTEPMGTCGQNSEFDDGKCYCKAGFNWCSEDPNDLDCCEDENQVSGTGETDTGTDTEGETDTGEPFVCEEEVEAPGPGESCEDGLAFCTYPDSCEEDVEGSRYFICEGGSWVEQGSEVGDKECQFAKFDFSYGCVDTGVSVDQVCGVGPGDSCTANQASTCFSEQILESCVMGRLSHIDCNAMCIEEIDEESGEFFEGGECEEKDGEIKCLCFIDDDTNG